MTEMRVLSLGWGVQSFTLAAMSAFGDIERLDVAIHADTLHEQQATYKFAEKWEPWLIQHGIVVVTVQNPTGGFWELCKRLGQTHVPAFTKYNGPKIMVAETEWIPDLTLPEDYDYDDDDPPGEWRKTGKLIEVLPKENGQLRRSCTHRWKIVPIRRWLQANRNGEPIEQWIGISTDEFLRMKPSDVKYVTHRWPLIELGMSRKDCEVYLSDHNIEIPVKSACVFCPFHDTLEWRKIQTSSTDWSEATAVDEKLRHLRPPYDLFIHPSRKPLAQVDLRTEEQKGQMSLWDEECTGICGV